MTLDIPNRVAVRAATRFTVQDGCYVSTYSVASHGYAQVGWNENNLSRVTTAHRAAWTLVNGQIPDGMTVDHLCKNRRCVRLEHLRVLSNYENARRTSGTDWELGICKHRHPNDQSYVTPAGRRICRPCRIRWHSDFKQRHKKTGVDLLVGSTLKHSQLPRETHMTKAPGSRIQGPSALS
jgi:hypothetical protein